MNILAIDIGTQTGWALSNRAGRILSGSESFAPKRNEGPGARWLKFRVWLAETRTVSGNIHVVYYEKVRNHTAVDAAHIYGGFEAMLQAWCESNRVRMVGVAVQTIKKSWTGSGNANKDAMIAMARSRGFNPIDDNHADALALLAYAIAKEQGDPTGQASTLVTPPPAALFA